MRSHWYVSAQAINKGKHSVVALFGHDQGTSHGLSMVYRYVICTSSYVHVQLLHVHVKPGSQFDARAANIVNVTGKIIFH